VYRPTAQPSGVVLVGVPGGTSNRRYFDLAPPDGGYSFAAHATARGHTFVAFDNLGTGASSQPDAEVGLAMQGDALAAALGAVPECAGQRLVAVAHSMGGYSTLLQQAAHRTFDAVAICGTTNQWVAPLDFGSYNDEGPSTLQLLVEEASAGPEARQAIADRISMGFPERYFVPDRGPMAHWSNLPDVPDAVVAAAQEQTLTYVPRRCAAESTVPGITADAAARVDVPVLLAYGEVDVSPDPHREPTYHRSCRDLTLLVVAGSAHCHNYSAVRVAFWNRLLAWIDASIAPTTTDATRT
jgi:pimeloyl-ACP methyl ester carboxylesterase